MSGMPPIIAAEVFRCKLDQLDKPEVPRCGRHRPGGTGAVCRQSVCPGEDEPGAIWSRWLGMFRGLMSGRVFGL
jgi:hypothetical protein